MRLCDHCDGAVLDDGGCANGCHRFTTDRLHAMVWYHGLERCLPALPTGTKKSVPFQLVYIVFLLSGYLPWHAVLRKATPRLPVCWLISEVLFCNSNNDL